jgi:hypothetical protein
MKQFKIYKRRFTEDDISDMVSGDSEIYADKSIETMGYKVVNIVDSTNHDSYKTFEFDNNFTLDKTVGIDTDPYFKKLIKTENNMINSKNYFYTIYFNVNDNDEFPYFEFGAISSSETELYQLAREHNAQEAIMGRYIDRMAKQKDIYRYQAIYPFEDGK